MERPRWGPEADWLPLVQLCIKSPKISTEKQAALKRQNIHIFKMQRYYVFFFSSSWDESENSSLNRFYIIKETSLPRGNQPSQKAESGENSLIFDSL